MRLTPPQNLPADQKNPCYSEQSGRAGLNRKLGALSCTPEVINYLRSVLSNFLSLHVAEYKNRDENISVHLKNTPRSPGRTW